MRTMSTRKSGSTRPLSRDQWEKKVLNTGQAGEELGKSKKTKTKLPDSLAKALNKLEVSPFEAAGRGVSRLVMKFQSEYHKDSINLGDVHAAMSSLEKMKGKADAKKKKVIDRAMKGLQKVQTMAETMNKHGLTGADANELDGFKSKSGIKSKDKPKKSPVQLMADFMAKAKPETKERMKGVSPADFMKLLGAIMDDEGAE